MNGVSVTGKKVIPVLGQFRSSSIDSTGGSSFSLTGLTLGPAAADRWIVAAIGFTSNQAGRSIGSVSINGNSMTQMRETNRGGGSVKYCSLGLFKRLLPTGTSATINVSVSGGITGPGNGCCAAVFTVPGGWDAEVTAIAGGANSADPSTTLNVLKGDLVIACALGDHQPTSVSWDGVSQTYDRPENDTRHSGGLFQAPGKAPGMVIKATFNGGWSGPSALVAAAMRKAA